MKRYAHYFLQSRPAGITSGHWETIEQSRAYSVLKSGLSREIANDRDLEIRLVGAFQEEETGEWSYTQLFYIDQTSIDLTVTDPDGEDDGPVPEYTADDDGEYEADYDEHEAGSGDDGADHGAYGRAQNDEASEADYRYRQDDYTEETEANDSPWRDDSAEGQGRPAFDDLPPVFRKPMPRKRRSGLKGIIIMLLSLLVAGGVAVGVLLSLQNPAILDLADKFGLGDYARMFPHLSASTDSSGMSPTTQEARVMPLTTGNVVTFKGIAPALVGRWSPDNCEMNYVIFSENGYTVTRGGQTSPEKVEISETLEDDFQYYLRRTPTLVEHLQKLGPNDIQMAGSTGTGGFMASGNTIQILTRCPRQ